MSLHGENLLDPDDIEWLNSQKPTSLAEGLKNDRWVACMKRVAANQMKLIGEDEALLNQALKLLCVAQPGMLTELGSVSLALLNIGLCAVVERIRLTKETEGK